VRRILLTANDPHRALFVDLALTFEGVPAKRLGKHLGEALGELVAAYPKMLSDLRERMLRALGHAGPSYETLRARAATVLGLSGDLRLDAFAARLGEFGGTAEEMEALAGFALNKPGRDWSDRDPDRAALELADLALRFRRAEALARVKGREPTQHAIAVVFGTGETGRTIARSVDIAEAEKGAVGQLARDLLKVLARSGSNPRVLLAALAEAGAQTADEARRGVVVLGHERELTE
jgi:hypothetical protein